MKNVLIIQNADIEGPGNLSRLLQEDEFDIRTVYAQKAPLPTELYSMLVILGGPQGANDQLQYLQDEQQLIRQFVEHEKPVLGICLGAQLIAKTFGASVHRGSKTEIGFYHDLHLDSASELFENFSNPFSAFHWHSDTFDLPDGATRLAHSEHYANQAFQIGTAIGVQFHFEVDRDMVDGWLDNMANEPAKIPSIDPQKIRDKMDATMPTIESNLEKFYKNFTAEFNL